MKTQMRINLFEADGKTYSLVCNYDGFGNFLIKKEN